jgi:hypothetical protein
MDHDRLTTIDLLFRWVSLTCACLEPGPPAAAIERPGPVYSEALPIVQGRPLGRAVDYVPLSIALWI